MGLFKSRRKRLTDIEVETVDLVDRPANAEDLILFKRSEGGDVVEKQDEKVKEDVEKAEGGEAKEAPVEKKDSDERVDAEKKSEGTEDKATDMKKAIEEALAPVRKTLEDVTKRLRDLEKPDMRKSLDGQEDDKADEDETVTKDLKWPSLSGPIAVLKARHGINS